MHEEKGPSRALFFCIKQLKLYMERLKNILDFGDDSKLV